MAAYWLTVAWAATLDEPADKIVLVCLADLAGSDGRCWPARRRIAELTALDEAQVKEALERLLLAGWITLEPGRRPAYRLRDLQESTGT